MNQALAYDPIHQEGENWYFWDETQADRYGPFPTRQIAEEMLTRYSTEVLGARSKC